MGRFSCERLCERCLYYIFSLIFLTQFRNDRLFDCGIHKCDKSCHPPSPTPDLCPRSPSKITRCPCGKNTIAPNFSVDQSLYTFSSRDSCTSPIPTCDSVCSKPNPACSHPCKAKCHIGPCPPCSVEILRPCRCGSTTKSLACHEAYNKSSDFTTNNNSSIVEENEILCDRPCAALRACGRHQCRRICCPLAALASSGKKGRRRVAASEDDGHVLGEEHGGLHECDLVCGKMLSCGNHKCEERDHKGFCRPCMRSSFQEVGFLLFLFFRSVC
jgi:transcriptional repressor NF-X1